jgi:transcriptional regulator with XRE-family HTH domain
VHGVSLCALLLRDVENGGETMTVAELIGGNIYTLRRAIGLTQAELAEAMQAIGFDTWLRQTVAETEAGRRDITIEELVAIAAFFEMPLRALLISPGSLIEMPDGIDVGDRTIEPGDWINLVEQGRSSPLDEAPKLTQQAIDALVGRLSRPWATRWRRRSKKAPETKAPDAYVAARAELLLSRERYPGPIFLWEGEGDLGRSTTIPPWGVSVGFTLKPGVPYVARDEFEAEELHKIIDEHPQMKLRVINRQEAYRLRKKGEN